MNTRDGEHVTPPLLQATDLVKVYQSARGGGTKTAVSHVSLTLAAGNCLGIVGESGCGKSTLARLLVGLDRPTAGTIQVRGKELGSYRRPERARVLQLVSQDPFSSLNPRLTAGGALAEVLRVHRLVLDKEAASRRVTELLEMVSLGPQFAARLPAEMSGGQAQRVAIARALAAEPTILILDEPTSALDVSVRAGIVNLLARLRAELELSYLFISHDVAVIRQLSDQIGVMYHGRFVETGPWDAVLSAPRHPYTRALIEAVPEPDPDGTMLADLTSPAADLAANDASADGSVDGAVDSSADTAAEVDQAGATTVSGAVGCSYFPRCPIRIERCRTVDPLLAEIAPGHEAACHLAGAP
jgi:oligopeptide transport system ATP-binding protein